MMDADPEGFKLEQDDLAHWAYEYAYKDGRINVSSLINDLESRPSVFSMVRVFTQKWC